MDKELKPAEGKSVDLSAFISRCKAVEKVFQEHGVDAFEMNVEPATGLLRGGVILSTGTVIDGAITFRRMKLVTKWNANTGFSRWLVQPLTKPMNISVKTSSRFKYLISAKADVEVKRLLVNLDDLEQAYKELVAESNRVYFLYCHPWNL